MRHDPASSTIVVMLRAETAGREERFVAGQLKVVRFLAYRDLAGFDFAGSEIDEALIRHLHRCDFIDVADNVVPVDGQGTGKTHVVTALGVQAVGYHRKLVRFCSTVERANALELKKAQGRAGQIANRPVHFDLVILDQLGYLPFSASGAHCCFICPANSTGVPASSSPPSSASVSEPACPAMQK